jgi:hypothetical protein
MLAFTGIYAPEEQTQLYHFGGRNWTVQLDEGADSEAL